MCAQRRVPGTGRVIAGDEAHDLLRFFGAQTIEAMVVDAQGAVRLLRVDVTRRVQAGEERSLRVALEQGHGRRTKRGSSIDLFQGLSAVCCRSKARTAAAGT